jgi:hypothetical protein
LKSRIEDRPDLNFVPYRELPTHIGEGPKIALSSRHKEPVQPKTPGPADYSPDFTKTKTRAPISSVHVRSQEGARAPVPGPADYTPDYSKIGAAAPQVSMHFKPRDPPAGPSSEYLKLGSTLGGPYFTIKNKEILDLAPY